jgi:multicomponent Na+:H+ antiporter subunit D
MSANIPPGFLLILGALLTGVTPGRAHKAWALLAPLAGLAAIWLFPADGRIVEHWLDYDLVLAQFNLPTKAFATIFALMALVGGLYAYESASRTELTAALLYAGSAIGVTFAGDLLTLFMFWEVMAIGSTLVVWAGGSERSRLAGRRYANVHLLGGAILLAGIALHVHATGSILLPRLQLGGELIDPVVMVAEGGRAWLVPTLDTPGSVLMLIGVLINTGVPLLGAWLPDAYPEATPSGTVFLSAFTTKSAVYVLIVLFAGANVLVWIGCLMTLYGIVYGLLENDLRRILAYSIVNQVGFMVAAIGLGTGLAINGATAHAFAHIIYKALLLMSAGSVLMMTGKRKLSDLGGLYKAMPLTMWCGIIGAMAISAVPLTSGFTTKAMISDAAAMTEIWAPVTEVNGQMVWDSLLHPSLAWFVILAASAGVFLDVGLKFPWFVFLQKRAPANDDRKLDPPASMKVAMLLFAFLCISLGLYPQPLYQLLPFQRPDGGEIYQAWTYAHVINQLQLLLFAGLAFVVLFERFKRTLTMTLDADWVYRRMIPALWQWVVRPLLLALQPYHKGLIEGLPRAAVKRFGAGGIAASKADQRRYRPWSVGTTVLLVTLLLAAFLALNLFGNSKF